MFNNKDFIYRKRAAYSQEGCDYTIRFFENRVDLQAEGTFGNLLPDPTLKKCTEMYLKIGEYPIFEDILVRSVLEYKKIYPYLCDHIVDFSPSSTFKLQKYKPKEGYFALHCENEGPGAGDNRILAWMIYLNDVTEGGYTRFPNQNRKFQPRRGDLLIWPAYFTHTHHGIVSKTQTKYIATGWFTFIDS
jgi:hypothetical protein